MAATYNHRKNLYNGLRISMELYGKLIYIQDRIYSDESPVNIANLPRFITDEDVEKLVKTGELKIDDGVVTSDYIVKQLEQVFSNRKRWRELKELERINNKQDSPENHDGFPNRRQSKSISKSKGQKIVSKEVINYHQYEYLKLKGTEDWLKIKSKSDPQGKGVNRIFYWDSEGVMQDISSSMFDYYEFK